MKTQFPWTASGLRYFTNDAGERICTGSQMGRTDQLPADTQAPVKLHLRLVPLRDGGCYDAGGAYWGQGAPLYCAFADEVEIYLRAYSRAEARRLVRNKLASVSFYQ